MSVFSRKLLFTSITWVFFPWLLFFFWSSNFFRKYGPPFTFTQVLICSTLKISVVWAHYIDVTDTQPRRHGKCRYNALRRAAKVAICSLSKILRVSKTWGPASGPQTLDVSTFMNTTTKLAINRFLMKLFSTSNMEIIRPTYCREQFDFELPSVILARHTSLFLDKLLHCDNCLTKKCYAHLTNLFCFDFVQL